MPMLRIILIIANLSMMTCILGGIAGLVKVGDAGSAVVGCAMIAVLVCNMVSFCGRTP